MTISAFIEDGYTETAYIEERSGIHPAVRIKFRPTPVTDRTHTLEAVRKSSGQARNRGEELMAEAVASKLASWEFLDEHGKPLGGVPEVSKQSVMKLKTALYDRITAIVFYGIDGGDIDPQSGDNSEPEKPAERLESDQKN